MADARPTTRPMLATHALTRNFGGLVAVRDVSISLHQGELHAVIGPNGAGKTTLVNMLSGEIHPTAGRIELDGRAGGRRAGLAHDARRRRPLVPAHQHLRDPCRCWRTCASPCRPSAPPRSRPFRQASSDRRLIDKAHATLQRVGLAGAAERLAGALSHGEQRQLEIAMTLAGDPKVLLLDEPLAGMGPEESERLTGLLQGLAREHAVLLIEHDMDFVFAVADWMTVMAEGTVLAEGKPATIRANTAVQEAYLGGHA